MSNKNKELRTRLNSIENNILTALDNLQRDIDIYSYNIIKLNEKLDRIEMLIAKQETQSFIDTEAFKQKIHKMINESKMVGEVLGKSVFDVKDIIRRKK